MGESHNHLSPAETTSVLSKYHSDMGVSPHSGKAIHTFTMDKGKALVEPTTTAKVS